MIKKRSHLRFYETDVSLPRSVSSDIKRRKIGKYICKLKGFSPRAKYKEAVERGKKRAAGS